MQRRIITATAVVAATTLLIGLVALVVMRRSIDNRAEQELRRQAAVTASQIEEDLERVEFRPGANPGVAVARYRNELLRSLSRAESLGDTIGLKVPFRWVHVRSRSHSHSF